MPDYMRHCTFNEFHQGDTVNHSEFGKGTVSSVNNTDQSIRIKFQNGIEKYFISFDEITIVAKAKGTKF